MKKFNIKGIVWALLLIFGASERAIHAQQDCNFYDNFDSGFLDTAKWDSISGNYIVENGRLILISNLAKRIKTDVQSDGTFPYGKLEIIAGSSNWKSGRLNDTTDTSIGFEIFYGKGCHNGIVITNGTMGILRAFPIVSDSCSGNPIFQRYFSIPNWDSLRKSENKYTIVWTNESIDLIINDRDTLRHETIPQDSIPNRDMKIRLNSNVDLDLNHGVTIDTLKINQVCYKSTLNEVKSDENLMPKEFSISQNFPNPFNPETIIKYQVPKQVRVRISIYNIFGQEVRALVNEEKSQGNYFTRWDGRDNLSRLVSSGIYLYRIEAEQFTQMKKMILIR